MHRKGCPLIEPAVWLKQKYFGFQISVIMSNQATLDKLPEKKNSSSDDQEHGHSMIEMLLDKVVKLEKGLKDLQLQGCKPCHKCKVSDQEKKASESVVKNLNLKLVEMSCRQGEIQQDLLLLVETCADFEKDLLETKKKNEQLMDQVKSLLIERKESYEESPSDKVKSSRIITISSESPPPAFHPSVSAPVFHPASFSHNFYLSGPEVWPEFAYDDTYDVEFQG